MAVPWDPVEVEKQHIESLKNQAAFLNAELVEAYKRQVEDWIRNEPVLRFLGQLPAVPTPARAWEAHMRESGGWVLEQSDTPVSQLQYKPSPPAQPTTIVAAVGGLIGGNIYEIGVGDNAPLGYVVSNSPGWPGKTFRKEGRRTPFGTMAYYERLTE